MSFQRIVELSGPDEASVKNFLLVNTAHVNTLNLGHERGYHFAPVKMISL